MNTVSASNSYSTSAATNRGMSGLVSNMDTESMVESLLSGTQSKIDKQNQEKQVTTWKQEFYRDIISDINKFKNSYFSSNSSTSLLSAGFFNSMSAVSKSDAISVMATADAPTGKTEIKVGQLATATKMQSGSTVSGELTGTIDTSALDRKVVFNTKDGGEVTVDLADCHTAQDIADKLTKEGISAKVDDKTGKLVIEGDWTSISSKSTKLGMDMLGVSAGTKLKDGKLETTADPKAQAKITVTLDGISHTITLDGMKDESDKQTFLQNKLNDEFGTGAVTVEITGDKMKMTTSQGREVSLSGDKTAMKLFGIENGASNKIALGQQLKDVGFSTALQGNSFKFTINNQEFNFNNTDTVRDVINEINSSNANVRITYSEIQDKFTMESAYTGAGHNIKLEQTNGNLLNAMFGKVANTGTTVESNALTTNTVSSSLEDNVQNKVNSVSEFSQGYFKLMVDGKNYSISVPKRSEENGGKYSRDEVMELVNEGLASRFGYKGDKQAIELIKNSDDTYQMKVRNGSKVSFAKTDAIYADDSIDVDKAGEAAKTNLQLAFGFEDTDNVAKSDKLTLADVGIQTLNINGGSDINSDTTIDAAISELSKNGITASFDEKTGKISLEGTGALTVNGTTSDGTKISDKLFGTNLLIFGAQQGTEELKTAGQNALITVNGVDTERSTNSFTVNGLNVTLSETTGEYKLDADGNRVFDGETVTIDSTRNTDEIFDGIKSFVDDYNKLIGDLNKRIDEDASYRDYPPLTSEQKKEMTEKEIELWEEKAKTGLLRNDMNISSLLSSMRSILYKKPKDCNVALYQIGIETSNDWKDKGKLVIDESKLRSMIETNSKDIEALFTDSQDGLAVNMSEAIDAAANTSSSSAGSLVSLAGVVGKATELTNTLTKQLRTIDDKIKELQDKYDQEKSRYWKMFNSMEATLSDLNTQSSWLSQQFGM